MKSKNFASCALSFATASESLRHSSLAASSSSMPALRKPTLEDTVEEGVAAVLFEVVVDHDQLILLVALFEQKERQRVCRLLAQRHAGKLPRHVKGGDHLVVHLVQYGVHVGDIACDALGKRLVLQPEKLQIDLEQTGDDGLEHRLKTLDLDGDLTAVIVVQVPPIW